MICKYPYTDTHLIHNPHECDQEIDQVRLHNFLLHKLSLPLSKFYMRLWQSKRPQFEYPSLSSIFSTKTMIGPATASYDLFMNTSAIFQVPYNTARCILFSLIFHILSGILAVEELRLLAMLLNTLQESSTLLYVIYMSMSLLPTRKSNSKPL